MKELMIIFFVLNIVYNVVYVIKKRQFNVLNFSAICGWLAAIISSL